MLLSLRVLPGVELVVVDSCELIGGGLELLEKLLSLDVARLLVRVSMSAIHWHVSILHTVSLLGERLVILGGNLSCVESAASLPKPRAVLLRQLICSRRLLVKLDSAHLLIN